MTDKTVQDAEPVLFREKLAHSQVFSNLFKEGMSLVEETAAYLDGPGRADSKELNRAASLAYATESMRLTTRLMQLASWLLLHRAVREGEMSLSQVNQDKTKVKLSAVQSTDPDAIGLLPEILQELIARSHLLTAQVRRLDTTMHGPAQPVAASNNPVESQLGLLKAAFEGPN
jgi:regulator of CtrA degradation